MFFLQDQIDQNFITSFGLPSYPVYEAFGRLSPELWVFRTHI